MESSTTGWNTIPASWSKLCYHYWIVLFNNLVVFTDFMIYRRYSCSRWAGESARSGRSTDHSLFWFWWIWRRRRKQQSKNLSYKERGNINFQTLIIFFSLFYGFTVLPCFNCNDIASPVCYSVNHRKILIIIISLLGFTNIMQFWKPGEEKPDGFESEVVKMEGVKPSKQSGKKEKKEKAEMSENLKNMPVCYLEGLLSF